MKREVAAAGACAALCLGAGLAHARGVFSGTSQAPLPAIAGRVARLLSEGPPPKLEPTSTPVRLLRVYYVGTVVPGGLVKPTKGEVQEAEIGGRKVALETPDISTGLLHTRAYGKVRVYFGSSLMSESVTLGFSAEQLAKLKGDARPAGPPATPAAAEAGAYRGSLPDGSTFEVTIVVEHGAPKASDVSYRFTSTGVRVRRARFQSRQCFGEARGNRLTFQLPILRELSIESLLNPAVSTGEAWYEVTLEWDRPGQAQCTLRRLEKPAAAYAGKFAAGNLSFRPPPKAPSLKPSYRLVVKRAAAGPGARKGR